MAKPVHAAIGEKPIRCQVCDNDTFREREVKLNSTGMEFFNMAWANESATGLICWSCGYVHLFVNRDVRLYRIRG
ncbi:hypothetical protein [Streptomyces vietnamensis]|uniref:DNA-binding protein n=1 Tax=Streptomyces vietnamensis TaxID=362257 RepID=A0A0B5I8E8_9ACTN|nr:hypothetical protein [Streptomyces vietnamensis]AJF68851.1 hypothetical protein SVTN_35565 [Streptomyces vietnamensis]